MKKIFHIQLFPFTYVAFTTTSVDISMHSHFVLQFLSCLSKINIPLFLPLFHSLHRKKLFTRTKSITNTCKIT